MALVTKGMVLLDFTFFTGWADIFSGGTFQTIVCFFPSVFSIPIKLLLTFMAIGSVFSFGILTSF
jgi:hypothetical protein